MNSMNVLKMVLAFAAIGLMSQPALAQDARLAKGSDVAGGFSYQLQGDWGISGFQFDVKYDPKTQSPLLDKCLSGLPESHSGDFASCKALPEKSMIRVVVMDLGRNRILPTDTTLGTIEFKQVGKPAASAGSKKGTRPEVSNVILAGADGKASEAPVDQAFKTITTR